MDRLACVDVPVLPLQLLLLREPELRGHPVVVVEDDKPLARVLFGNEEARRRGVQRGMRYAAALSLVRDLRAGVVGAQELNSSREKLTEELLAFSPDVEVSQEEHGVFWLNASGLDPLFPSLRAWGERVRNALLGGGFFSTVVIGFSRFGSWAIARSRPGFGVIPTREQERKMASQVSLEHLLLTSEEHDALLRLGVDDVGKLARLPAAALRRRFSREVHHIHRIARGELEAPLRPERPSKPEQTRELFEESITDTERLLFFIKRALGPLLRRLVARQELLAALSVRLTLERDEHNQRGEIQETIRAAAPTLDEAQWMNLLQLRVSTLTLGRGVSELHLEAESVRAGFSQTHLFSTSPGLQGRVRDVEAGARALARVRARFGEDAVVRARLTPGHLPEASYAFEAIQELSVPETTSPSHAPRRLVRRLLEKPQPLPPRPKHEPDGWVPRGLTEGTVVKICGPYVISGGWWRSWQQREYCFAETQSGALLWLYYDRRKRQWFSQGRVG
ncbi:MAG: DNA polymerase Y family protein [Myxococcota bacterium]